MSAQHRELPDGVVAPAPTMWPMLAALGATLVFAGLVTHVAATIVGAVLFVVSAVGWFRAVLPEEETEVIAFVTVVAFFVSFSEASSV